MVPRDLKTLLADGETPETIQSALDALADIDDPKWVAATRAELLQELRAIEGQGSLF
jgi:hypothetical protein